MLYEGWHSPNPEFMRVPEDVAARVDALVAEGRREAALELFFREVVGMPEAAEQVLELLHAPT